MVDVAHFAVSMGDPRGIGPEVILSALARAEVRALGAWIVLGAGEPFARAARALAHRCAPPNYHTIAPALLAQYAGSLRAGDVLLVDAVPWTGTEHNTLAAAGEASFACVEYAIALAQLAPGTVGRCDAVITAPIAKDAWAAAGHGAFPGHTELFATRTNARNFAMMFHAPALPNDAPTRVSRAGLNVVLATIHRPLRSVANVLSAEHIADTIGLAHTAMRQLGAARPRVGVCGLNPHAGEGGLLGDEDAKIIAPAVALARGQGIDATGPLPADTIFVNALSTFDAPAKQFDVVVAMYHDQGLIPLKTLAWERAVNWTIGLPIIRTSPDHGTALDIAGQGIADPGSMIAALQLAARLARA